jgi:hypothetical protein
MKLSANALNVACILSAILLIAVTLVLIAKDSKRSEHFPYGPVQALLPQQYNPYSTQYVYSKPSDEFQLKTAQMDGAGAGAVKSLQIAEGSVNYEQGLNIDWQVNQGFNNTGNTTWDLSLAGAPWHAWDVL